MHRANGPESVEVAGIRAPGGAASAADPRSDNNGSALTKDQRIEKGRFMNRVANMNPERRLKKLLSDRYANMSEERRAKKKESNRILNRPENMSHERKMRKRLSDSAAHMSVERKEKKKESQRKRNLSKMKVPRVPLTNEKREQKNERGKIRRAAKKAGIPTSSGPDDLGDSTLNDLVLSELPTLPSSSSSYFPSTSTSTLSVDNIRDRNPGTNLEVNTHEEGVAHQIAHRIIENNVENEDDSESDKDDDEGGSKAVNTNGLNSSSMSHTIAAVPVEDEPDNSNSSTENRNPLPLPLHDSLQTHPPTHALIPLESMTTININDINSQSTHPLSRKRKILK